MCENDPIVDAWFKALEAEGMKRFDPNTGAGSNYIRGHMRGVIRELAATVPGVREWLVENMPK